MGCGCPSTGFFCSSQPVSRRVRQNRKQRKTRTKATTTQRRLLTTRTLLLTTRLLLLRVRRRMKHFLPQQQDAPTRFQRNNPLARHETRERSGKAYAQISSPCSGPLEPSRLSLRSRLRTRCRRHNFCTFNCSAINSAACREASRSSRWGRVQGYGVTDQLTVYAVFDAYQHVHIGCPGPS